VLEIYAEIDTEPQQESGASLGQTRDGIDDADIRIASSPDASGSGPNYRMLRCGQTAAIQHNPDA
jgi:hypothetical protein